MSTESIEKFCEYTSDALNFIFVIVIADGLYQNQIDLPDQKSKLTVVEVPYAIADHELKIIL